MLFSHFSINLIVIMLAHVICTRPTQVAFCRHARFQNFFSFHKNLLFSNLSR